MTGPGVAAALLESLGNADLLQNPLVLVREPDQIYMLSAPEIGPIKSIGLIKRGKRKGKGRHKRAWGAR